MKSPVLDSVSVAMATKCSSGVSVTTDMVHMRSGRSHRHAHANYRKSAVELLEASKGTYVKSTNVLNHRQELKHPENLSVGNREVLSLPITAGKLSPSEDLSSVTKESVRKRSKSREGSQHTPERTESQSPVGERDSNRSPPLYQSDNLKPISSDTSSPLSVKKTSVTSSVSSSLSWTSKSPSVPKKPTASADATDTKLTSVAPCVVSHTESSTFQVKKLSISSSVTSSTSHTSVHSHTKDEDDSKNLKTPVTTTPKPGPKPIVPPKPGSASKPTTPPKPGPKPVTQTQDKPVPPPRSGRKLNQSSVTPAENTAESCLGTMASSDKKSTTESKSQVSDSTDQKRFSSVSASACETSSKDQSDKSFQSRESRHSLHSHNEGFLKPLCVNSLSTSVGVLVEKSRSPLPKPRIDKQLNEIELPPRRQLHRSQSDLSNCRHSRTSSDFSDLSSRISRTSTEVERFFNEMGIDREVLEPMRKLCETKKKEVLDSLSSFDSLEGHSLSSRLSNDLERLPMESEQDLSGRDAGSTSVVERNARIIKWLCNVKKARNVQTRPVRKKSETQS